MWRIHTQRAYIDLEKWKVNFKENIRSGIYTQRQPKKRSTWREKSTKNRWATNNRKEREKEKVTREFECVAVSKREKNRRKRRAVTTTHRKNCNWKIARRHIKTKIEFQKRETNLATTNQHLQPNCPSLRQLNENQK